MRQMVLILKRQQPFLILFLVFAVLSGFGFLANSGTGPVPHWIGAAWAGALFFTGSLGLAGILWQRWNVLRGIAVTRGALMMQAGLVVVYAGLLGLYLPLDEWAITLAAGATWTMANLWESRLMARDIGRVMEAAGER